MTKPRTPEEIAEEWFKIHDGMCVRSIDGQSHREHFLAALREAADAAHEAGLKLGTTLQAEAIEQALREEREALRLRIEAETDWDWRASLLKWLAARS